MRWQHSFGPLLVTRPVYLPGRALENLRFAFSKPPFVISTEAKRSGGICGHPFPKLITGHNGPTLCHLDRSVPGFLPRGTRQDHGCCFL